MNEGDVGSTGGKSGSEREDIASPDPHETEAVERLACCRVLVVVSEVEFHSIETELAEFGSFSSDTFVPIPRRVQVRRIGDESGASTGADQCDELIRTSSESERRKVQIHRCMLSPLSGGRP